MEDKTKTIIGKIGVNVKIYKNDGTAYGNAVIYPITYGGKSDDLRYHSSAGISEIKKYAMFGDCDLLKNTVYGNIVDDGKYQYKILWIDEFFCKDLSYFKAYMLRMTDGE